MGTTSSASTSNAIPVIESVMPAPVVAFNPVIEYVSEDVARAVPTLVDGDAAAALAGACAVSSPAPAVQQIVAEERTQDFVSTPVDTGFHTRWERQCEVLRVGDRHDERELRVQARVCPPPPLVVTIWYLVHTGWFSALSPTYEMLLMECSADEPN